ncbi:hypothetical protein RI367_008244 [Sorochytrium milnesiophthora]
MEDQIHSADAVLQTLSRSSYTYKQRLDFAQLVWDQSTIYITTKASLLAEWLAKNLVKSAGFKDKIVDFTPMLTPGFWALLGQLAGRKPQLKIKFNIAHLYEVLFDTLATTRKSLGDDVAATLVAGAVQCFPFFVEIAATPPAIEQVLGLIVSYIKFCRSYQNHAELQSTLRGFEQTLVDQARQRAAAVVLNKKYIAAILDVLYALECLSAPESSLFVAQVEEVCASVLFSTSLMPVYTLALRHHIRRFDTYSPEEESSASALNRGANSSDDGRSSVCSHLRSALAAVIKSNENATFLLPKVLNLYIARYRELQGADARRQTGTLHTDVNLAQAYPYAMFLELGMLVDARQPALYRAQTHMLAVLHKQQIYQPVESQLCRWMRTQLSGLAADSKRVQTEELERWKTLFEMDLRLVEPHIDMVWQALRICELEGSEQQQQATELLVAMATVYGQSRRLEEFCHALYDSITHLARKDGSWSSHPLLAPPVVECVATLADALSPTQRLNELVALVSAVYTTLDPAEPSSKRRKASSVDNKTPAKDAIRDPRVFLPYFAALARHIRLPSDQTVTLCTRLARQLADLIAEHLDPSESSKRNSHVQFTLLSLHNLALANVPGYADIALDDLLPMVEFVQSALDDLVAAKEGDRSEVVVPLCASALAHVRHTYLHTLMTDQVAEALRSQVQNVLDVLPLRWAAPGDNTTEAEMTWAWSGSVYGLQEHVTEAWWLLVLQHLQLICLFAPPVYHKRIGAAIAHALCLCPAEHQQKPSSQAAWGLLSCAEFFEIGDLARPLCKSLLRLGSQESTSADVKRNVLKALQQCPSEYIPSKTHGQLWQWLTSIESVFATDPTILSITRDILCRLSPATLDSKEVDPTTVMQLYSLPPILDQQTATTTAASLQARSVYMIRRLLQEHLNKACQNGDARLQALGVAGVSKALDMVTDTLKTSTALGAMQMDVSAAVLDTIVTWIKPKQKQNSEATHNIQYSFIAEFEEHLAVSAARVLKVSPADVSLSDLAVALCAGTRKKVADADRAALLRKTTAAAMEQGLVIKDLGKSYRQLLEAAGNDQYQELFLEILSQDLTASSAPQLTAVLDVVSLWTASALQGRGLVTRFVITPIVNLLSTVVLGEHVTFASICKVVNILLQLAQDKLALKNTFLISLMLSVVSSVLQPDLGARLVCAAEQSVDKASAAVLFTHITSILSALLANYRVEVNNILPVVVQILKDLLYCFRSPSAYSPPAPSKTAIAAIPSLPRAFLISYFSPLPAVCASSYARVLSSLEYKVVHQAEQQHQHQQQHDMMTTTEKLSQPLSRHFIHLLAEFVTIQTALASKPTNPWYGWSIAQPDVLREITQAMYVTFDICHSGDRAYLMASVDSAGSNILKALYSEYTKYYKYTGKV